MGRSALASVLSGALGWSYFFAWSLSFYPQVFDNRRRRSVVGMSFEYQLFNILGYSCYSLYTAALLWDGKVMRQYNEVFNSNLVTRQDFAFAAHGLLLTLVTVAQCFMYDRGTQTIAPLAVVMVAVAVALTAIFGLAIAIAANEDATQGPKLIEGLHVLSWLAFVYWLSVVKLGVTLCKYVPQAVMNFRRRSTVGWSIGNVLLDFSGGFLSVAQLLLDGYTLGWGGLVGDPIKFGLGFVSVFFDVVYMVQHYCLYTDRTDPAVPALDRTTASKLLGETVPEVHDPQPSFFAGMQVRKANVKEGRGGFSIVLLR